MWQWWGLESRMYANLPLLGTCWPASALMHLKPKLHTARNSSSSTFLLHVHSSIVFDGTLLCKCNANAIPRLLQYTLVIHEGINYIIWKRYVLTKFLQHCRHSTDREVALMMLMAYLSYMLAEVCFYGSYFCLPILYSSHSRRILVLCICNFYQVLIFFACCSSSIWVEFLRYSSVGLSCLIIHGIMWPRAREWPPSTAAYLR